MGVQGVTCVSDSERDAQVHDRSVCDRKWSTAGWRYGGSAMAGNNGRERQDSAKTSELEWAEKRACFFAHVDHRCSGELRDLRVDHG